MSMWERISLWFCIVILAVGLGYLHHQKEQEISELRQAILRQAANVESFNNSLKQFAIATEKEIAVNRTGIGNLASRLGPVYLRLDSTGATVWCVDNKPCEVF